MLRLNKEHTHRLEYKIIHVNFDHAWAEHYPVTLNKSKGNWDWADILAWALFCETMVSGIGHINCQVPYHRPTNSASHFAFCGYVYHMHMSHAINARRALQVASK